MKLPSSSTDDKLSCSMPSQRRFSCPLTKCIMEDPVSVPCCGANFERRAILKWMRKNGCRCPESGESLSPSQLSPNTMLQWEILYLERKNSKEEQGSSRTEASHRGKSSPASPAADMPPSMPRSHSTPDARKNTLSPDNKMPRSPSSTPSHAQNIKKLRKQKAPASSRRSCLNESCHSRVDVPPTKPRGSLTTKGESSSTTSTLSLKRMDSAPSLPQRKNGNAHQQTHHLLDLFASSQSVSSMQNDIFIPAAAPNTQKQDIVSLIDDVLAILEDGQQIPHSQLIIQHTAQ
jgi:hypothetical protein